MEFRTGVCRIGMDIDQPKAKKDGDGCYTKIRIAESYKKSNGEQDARWYDVTLFDKLAENTYKLVGKGCRVLIEGDILPGKPYTNSEGVKMYGNEQLIARHIEFIDYKKDLEKNKNQNNVAQNTTSPEPESVSDTPIDEEFDC